MSRAEDIWYALAWNPDALRRVREGPPRRFYDAMHLEFSDETPSDLGIGSDPLDLAAYGLASEYSDDQDEAERRYRLLIEQQTFEARLMGLTLLAWLGEGNPDALRQAMSIVDESTLQDGWTRRQISCKLLAISLDIADLEAASQCLDQALAGLPVESRLRDRLDSIGHICLNRDRTVYVGGDPLNDELPGEAHALLLLGQSARSGLENAFLDTVRSPWRRTIRFGSREINAISAAEAQGTWMGAPWLVPSARKQLAIRLLSDHAQQAENSELGLAYWFLGGGGDPLDVGTYAERHLTSTSANTILRIHMRMGARYGYREQYLKACSSLWSLLPTEIIRDVLSDPTSMRNGPAFQEAAKVVWTTAAVMAPEEWEASIAQLTDEQRIEVLDAMSDEVLRRMPAAAGAQLFSLAVSRWLTGSDRPSKLDEAVVRLHMADTRSRPLPLGFVENMDDVVISAIGQYAADLVGVESLVDRVDRRLERARRLIEQGRQGTETIFGYDPMLVLGTLASMAPSPSSAVEETLISAAVDGQVPSSYRMSALAGLRRYAEAHSLAASSLRRLEQVELEVRTSPLDQTKPDQLRARQLSVLFAAGQSDARGELVRLARHPDARVRLESLSALASLKDGPFDIHPIVLIGALFDPAPEVVRSALYLAVSTSTPKSELITDLVVDRLRQLFKAGPAEDRAAAVRAARVLAQDGVSLPTVAELIRDASTDRSWLVRDALRAGDL